MIQRELIALLVLAAIGYHEGFWVLLGFAALWWMHEVEHFGAMMDVEKLADRLSILETPENKWDTRSENSETR